MTRFFRSAALAAFAATAWASLAAAHDYVAGDLVIGHPWTRATPPGAGVAAGYATIRNDGETADVLIGGAFAVAERVEIHEMAVVDDVMRMRELAEGIVIAPGESVELRPGGLHMMFMGLGAQLKEGETVEGVMAFERAGRVPVVFKVEAVGARGEAEHDQHGHGHGHGRGHSHGDEK